MKPRQNLMGIFDGNGDGPLLHGDTSPWGLLLSLWLSAFRE